MTGAGFPHSDIRGSKLGRQLPRLFAATHVLLRLQAPRHPPLALCSLENHKDARARSEILKVLAPETTNGAPVKGRFFETSVWERVGAPRKRNRETTKTARTRPSGPSVLSSHQARALRPAWCPVINVGVTEPERLSQWTP